MRRRAFLRAVGVAGVAATAGCGGNRPTPTVPPDAGDVVMNIAEQEHYFDPVGLYVEPGETVTWTNVNGVHSTVAYNGRFAANNYERRIPEAAEGWNSPELREFGATVGWTAEVPGTYDYFDRTHVSQGVVGRIVVGGPRGAAAPPTPPPPPPPPPPGGGRGAPPPPDAPAGRAGARSRAHRGGGQRRLQGVRGLTGADQQPFCPGGPTDRP